MSFQIVAGLLRMSSVDLCLHIVISLSCIDSVGLAELTLESRSLQLCFQDHLHHCLLRVLRISVKYLCHTLLPKALAWDSGRLI